MMKIDISHIAKLANLYISEHEKEKFGKQLSDTIDYIDILSEIDIKDVEPTSQVTDLENITREDTTCPSLPQEEVLKNAKSTHNGFFKVKAILDS